MNSEAKPRNPQNSAQFGEVWRRDVIQSLARLQNVPLGFSPEGIMSFQLAPPPSRYPDQTKRWTFYRRALESLSTIPGVTGEAFSSITGTRNNQRLVQLAMKVFF
jgi:hypothetical protein